MAIRLSAIGLGLALLVTSSALATPPPPPPPLPPGAATYTPEQLTGTSAPDLMRQMFADWGRDFVERRVDRNFVDFYTKPHAGEAGVCSATRLRYNLQTSSKGETFINGVSVKQLFALVDPGMPFDPRHVAGYEATIPVCEDLPAGVAYFSAPTPAVVAYQHNMIAKAVASAKTSASLRFDLICARGGYVACSARKVLASLDPGDIRSIVARECGRDQQCFEVRVGDWFLSTDSHFAEHDPMFRADQILERIVISSVPRSPYSWAAMW